MWLRFFTTRNPVILGIYTNPTTVGYYTSAEKLMNAGQSLLGVVSQAVYPHVTQLFKESRISALVFLKKLTRIMALSTFLICIAVAMFAHLSVVLFLGSKYNPSIDILRTLSVVPFMVSLSNIFGIQTMLSLGLKRQFSRIIFIGATVNIGFSFLLVPWLAGEGTAISVVISETVITGGMYLYLRFIGINMFSCYR